MSSNAAITIHRVGADDAEDLAIVRDLFNQYAEWLSSDHGISLEFQNIDEELASLPGKYAPPHGALLLAKNASGNARGCIAVRPFQGSICELKRLYVHPDARGLSVGKHLVSAILERATELGYKRAVLDTGKFMEHAQKLYTGFGFSDIPPYYHNPFPGMRYLGADL